MSRKTASSDPPTPFRMPGKPVAGRTSNLGFKPVQKTPILGPVREASGESRLKGAPAMLLVYFPLVIARWIHFASVFLLFGSSFFWFYAGSERSSAGPGGLPRTLSATTIL